MYLIQKQNGRLPFKEKKLLCIYVKLNDKNTLIILKSV